MGGSAERKVSTQCAGKNNCNGCWQDLETPLLESLKIRPPQVASLRPANNTQHVLGDSWGHFHSSDGDIYNQYRPPPQMVCSVSVTKSYKISWIWRKEKICILCLFLFTLFIFTYRLISRKEILIYLSLLKPLRWHSRGCLLLKMLHLPPCSHCLY